MKRGENVHLSLLRISLTAVLSSSSWQEILRRNCLRNLDILLISHRFSLPPPRSFLAKVLRRSQLHGTYKNSVEEFQIVSCTAILSTIHELRPEVYNVSIKSFAKMWADARDIKSASDKTRQLFQIYKSVENVDSHSQENASFE